MQPELSLDCKDLLLSILQEPPNTTTPMPPPPEVDEGLTLGALIAIARHSAREEC